MTLKLSKLFFDRFPGEGGKVLLHLFRNAFNGNHHLGIHRIDGEIQDFGHILVAEAVFPHQLKDHFAPGRQGLYGRGDPAHQFCADHFLVRRLVPAQGYIHMVKGFRDLLAGFGGKVIKGTVLYGHIEVNPDIGNGRHLFPLFPQLNEYVVHNLHRWLLQLHNGIGELVEPRTVMLKQPAECLLIPIPDALKLYS